MSIKNSINESTDRAINRIDRRIDVAENSIAALGRKVEQQERGLDDKIRTVVMTEIAKSGKTGPGESGNRENRRDRAYDLSRKSLKLWPVEGQDLVDSVRVFLNNKLKFSDARIRLLVQLEVTRSPGKAGAEKKEVLVTFDCKEDRDMVKAAGINLAGDQTTGMSIHVPGFLLDNFHALNGVGYSIKMKHTGVKRSIKFDDDARDIYLDIFVGGIWKRITPVEAKKVAKDLPNNNNRNISSEELTSLVQGEPAATVVVPAGDET